MGVGLSGRTLCDAIELPQWTLASVEGSGRISKEPREHKDDGALGRWIV